MNILTKCDFPMKQEQQQKFEFYLRDYIFGSFNFLEEVTFKNYFKECFFERYIN